MSRRSSRRLLAPEVVQTSAMDCGPAALKSVLEGHGIHVSYARLRDACQTDVDGTSIDTMETVANQLGLEAEQIVIPADHLPLPEAGALPAILVVRLSDRLTHFVVVWRRHGRLVQVMDPAAGRRWMPMSQLLAQLYIHRMSVPADGWRAWAGSDEFQRTLATRIARLGLKPARARNHIEAAASDPSWRALGTLDAVTRMVQSLADSGGLRRGAEARAVLERLNQQIQERPAEWNIVPERYWSVRPVAAGGGEAAQLMMRGAVLVRFRGVVETGTRADAPAPLSEQVAATLAERPMRPAREMFGMLRADPAFPGAAVAITIACASIAVVVEALLFRGLFDIGRDLGIREQRVAAVVALVLFTLLLTSIEVSVAGSLFAAGRRLETRLRLRFFQRVPRLGDRYFLSRLTSDIAARVHSLHQLRELPWLAGRVAHLLGEAIATTAGIIWIDPESAPLALLLVAVTLAVPLGAYAVLAELDMRMRTHAGALSRYYLDALLGMVPIRTHGAERPLRREHGRVMHEWLRSGAELLRASVFADAVQGTLGFGIAAWLLLSHLARGGDATSLLLLYWALRIPVLGEELAGLCRQYPATRNVMLRILEPLTTPVTPLAEAAETPAASGGVSLAMDRVSVRAAGHLILRGVNVTIPAGAHVAVVGASGAGKSTLVGLLLGWHNVSDGQLLVDGALLDPAALQALRRVTVWVDPAVHLWNRSLLENMQYGNPPDARRAAGFAVVATDLHGLIEQLPDGLQTPLGEGGALVSGGEGQRVRLARGLLRPDVRLVILDEPFRGLTRDSRQRLLTFVRQHWRNATLLCISHDVAETLDFDRVLVVDDGVIAEDGNPRELASADSRYRRLLRVEEEVRDRLWSDPAWRHVRIDEGHLVEGRLRT